MGNPDELYYAEDAIKRAVVTQAAKSDNDDDDTNSSNNPNDGVNNIITHRVTCNNNKTFDGIVAGGTRVAKEVQDFITNYMKENHTNDEDDGGLHQAASISFIGYSLGGMYSRYAISILPLEFEGITLNPFSFVTAATPHLGMASHSYVILPRLLEGILGYGFGHTGQDLFRLHRDKKKRNKNSTPKGVVYRMATEDAFLRPLSVFHQRIAYISAFDSDFMVPTATAGMLSSHSKSQHYHIPDYNHWKTEDIGFDVLAFQTRSCDRIEGTQSSGTRSDTKDETLTMSLSLDSLGWTKVFVDCRKGMTQSSIRCICRKPRKGIFEDAVSTKRAALQDDGEAISFESNELCNLLKSSEYWHLAPTGHFLLVAHSKTKRKRGAKKYAMGRPLVDNATAELVNDVREFSQQTMRNGLPE